MFVDINGRAQTGEVFNNFLVHFHTADHLNGQHSVQLAGEPASGINCCHVLFVGELDGKNIIHNHGVRYQDNCATEWTLVDHKTHCAFYGQ